MTLDDLHGARRAGRRPAGPVVLALVRPPQIPEPDAVVIACKRDPHDLRCLVDLDVVIAAVTAQANRVIEIGDRCLRFGVTDLEAWLCDRDRWIALESGGQRYLRRVPPRW